MTTTSTTRDYLTSIAEWQNGNDEPYPWPDEVNEDDGTMPRRCGGCERPAYYDDADDSYHHANRADEGCGLIPAEDRPDDDAHPLAVIRVVLFAIVEGTRLEVEEAAFAAHAQLEDLTAVAHGWAGPDADTVADLIPDGGPVEVTDLLPAV